MPRDAGSVAAAAADTCAEAMRAPAAAECVSRSWHNGATNYELK